MRPPIFFGVTGATALTVIAFWVVFYVWFGLEMYLGYRKRSLPPGTTERDRGSKFALIGSIWASVVIGISLAMAFPGAAIAMGRDALFATGLLAMVAGMVLRWYSIRVLGASFMCSVAIRPGQRVVDRGPYRWVRHPSYSGGLLTVAGILLCCLNWLSLFAIAVALAGYAYRIRVEETALADGLGDEYRAYLRRTRRLIPFVL